MKVKVADTFVDSLQRMIDHEKWYWKLWFFIKRDLPRFFKNIWLFREALWDYNWWDHHGILKFTAIGLTHMSNNLEETGLEIPESRLKKVAAMRRVIQIIQNYNDSSYLDMAKAELGEIFHRDWDFKPIDETETLFEIVDTCSPAEKEHNTKVFNRAREIEESEWKELWAIMKGQDYSEYKKLVESMPEKEQQNEDRFYKWFDGSGMKGWWD
jgi:hypothetical protein